MVNCIHPKSTFIYILLISLLISAGESNASSLIPPQVKFRPILTSDIEKLAFINTIFQDKEGFLWFGSIQGLARYDGYEIKIYRHDANNPNSLPHNWIKSLQQTRDGHLWALTYMGACQFLPDTDSFKCLELPDTNKDYPPSYYSFFEHQDGTIWLSTSIGIKIVNPKTLEVKSAPESINNALPPLRDSEANYINDIVAHKDGRMWFGTHDNGLVFYDPNTTQVKHFTAESGLGSNKIQDLLIDSKDSLWIATLGGGLFQFDNASEQFNLIEHDSAEKSREVWSITEDDNGLYWIGDGNGVHLYDPVYKEFSAYSYVEGEESGPGNFVTRTIYHDNVGGTWLGYFPSGVDRVDRLASQFKNYRHNPSNPYSLADGGVISTLEDESGNLWVGCGFGLSYLDRKTDNFITYRNEKNNPNSLSGSTILDMDSDLDGNIWIGAWDKGINKFNREKMEFTRYQEDPSTPGSLFGREPWAVLVDSANTLWVGTEKGLNRFDPKNNNFIKIMPENENGEILSNLYIREVYEDSKGMLLIGSFNGLYLLNPVDNKFIKHFINEPNNANSLTSNQVTSIFEDREGHIWVGTGGAGLNKINLQTNQVQHFLEKDGLINLNISGIVEDQTGNLWISTYHGLSRLNINTETFTSFTKNDGPIGNLYNRNSPMQLRTGELVFGSTRGLTIFDPLKLDSEGVAPSVALTDFSIFNKSVIPGEKSALKKSIITADHIDLNYDQSVFSFEFAALDYNSPQENRYRYRLLGFEENWNEINTQRHATYTNLDPGNYILQVSATNNYGIWSEKPREISIHIRPPWWDTSWAWLVYILIFVVSVYRMIYVYRNKLTYERNKVMQERAIVKQLKEIDLLKDQINRELDSKVEERTSELQREHLQLVNAQRELKLLNSRLEEMSVTDILTGLKNRRFLYQTIDADISRLARLWSNQKLVQENSESLEGLTFVLLDIDHFKKINDKYGHTAGDQALIQLSNVISANVRESDFVIRWGGEEFVIVLRHLPRTASFQIAHRIYNAIKSYKATLNNDAIVDIRCSMGIVFYPFLALNPNAFSWEQVLNIADQALYCAKQSGRDCWVSVETPYNIKDPQHFPELLLNNGINSEIILDQLEVRSSRPLQNLTWFDREE